MGANELLLAAAEYLQNFQPIVLILAIISVADLIIWFAVRVVKKAPDYGFTARRRTR